MTIGTNFKTVMDRIAAAAKRANRDPASVKLVTVTKTVSREGIREALSSGARVLGENRVQEAKEKIEQLGQVAGWHLIGHLQTNKAKYAVKLFDLIHSVDNLELAAEIDKQAAKLGKVQDVLIEVSIAGEAAKAGVGIDDAASLVRQAATLRNIRIKGLMTMPPYSDNPEASRPYFRKLKELSSSIEKENIPGVSMAELSMGMSGDFEVAIEEGATLVRVGTAIFGERF
ncbi:MAG: YggS family pyridoxal phosphate enzyme [Nitrospirae bacterium GWC2_56_14]|nr:MAG: YggS family pyridoxal phosphate enzyme [Nitrospirae bacterium GWC2_56_14]